MTNAEEPINLVVAGAGEGTYRNLRLATKQTAPNLNMRIAVVIDVKDKNELHPQMQDVLNEMGALYVKTSPGASMRTVPIPENAAAIVMTPNNSHIEYAEKFAELGLPVYVEKPVATSTRDLEKFLFISRQYPRQIYAAEPCTDGKTLGFLYAMGGIEDDDPRLKYVSINPPTSAKKIRKVVHSLGMPKMIFGKMLEGDGTAGTADHRQWLLDGVHGGMIRDLASHIFGPLYDSGLASTEVLQPLVALGEHKSGMAPGTWRLLKDPLCGETFADIRGWFVAPHGIPKFSIQLGKYWPKHDRCLKISFENGHISMSYEKPFELAVENWESGNVSISVTADFYPALALLDFKEFIAGRNDGHISRAAAIVLFNEKMRKIGLETRGL